MLKRLFLQRMASSSPEVMFVVVALRMRTHLGIRNEIANRLFVSQGPS